MRRFGRPSLLGLAAGTAVVAGTATAVSGGMQRRQYNRMQEDQALQDAAQAQQQQQIRNEAAAAVASQSSATSTGPSLLDSVNQLAQLHANGVLSDEEFSAAKAKLLA
jgi:hypothetical protein